MIKGREERQEKEERSEHGEENKGDWRRTV